MTSASGGLGDLVRSAAEEALALLLPVACAGCGREDRVLCRHCRSQLEATPRLRGLGEGLPVLSGLRYEGIAARVIASFKESGSPVLARALAAPLRAALEAAVAEAARCGADAAALELVPVPSSQASFGRRGFSPIGLVARSAGLRLHPCLSLTGRAPEQKALGVEERQQNRMHTLRAHPGARGRQVLLVDDVVTTGATLTAAAQALREAGGTVLGALAIADTPRRNGAARPH